MPSFYKVSGRLKIEGKGSEKERSFHVNGGYATASNIDRVLHVKMFMCFNLFFSKAVGMWTSVDRLKEYVNLVLAVGIDGHAVGIDVGSWPKEPGWE